MKKKAPIKQRQIGPTVHIHQGSEKTWRAFSPFEKGTVRRQRTCLGKSECHEEEFQMFYRGPPVQVWIVFHVKQKLRARTGPC